MVSFRECENGLSTPAAAAAPATADEPTLCCPVVLLLTKKGRTITKRTRAGVQQNSDNGRLEWILYMIVCKERIHTAKQQSPAAATLRRTFTIQKDDSGMFLNASLSCFLLSFFFNACRTHSMQISVVVPTSSLNLQSGQARKCESLWSCIQFHIGTIGTNCVECSPPPHTIL